MSEQPPRKNNAWIGPLIFLFFISASRLMPFLANVISQNFGIAVSSGQVFAAIVAGGIVIAIFSSIIGGIRNAQRRSGGGLPPRSTMPRSPTATALPKPIPSVTRLPTREEKLPKWIKPSGASPLTPYRPQTPRFDPIIAPRVLRFSIVGFLLYCGLIFIASFSGFL
ncbi:hypothetical protein HC891_22460 [Candidatus Gracilibacteria bacterium]|nr:hypothetical protein [Candidatus Gracilibacteria bacterium]